MVVIRVFQENHSEKNSLERVGALLAELPRGKVTLYHEAVPSGHIETNGELLYKGQLDFESFWAAVNLEVHWAPAENYKQLYQTAYELGCEFRGLDQIMPIREHYAEGFRDWAKHALAIADVEDISGWKARFEPLRTWLSPMRELSFAETVVKDTQRVIKEGKMPVVITHPVHVGGVVTNLRRASSTDKVIVPEYPEAQRIANGKEEDAIQRKASESQNILELRRRAPPLVPAVTLAFDTLEKLEKHIEKRT